jgi:hypothetical protein
MEPNPTLTSKTPTPTIPTVDLTNKPYDLAVDSIHSELISDIIKDFIKLKLIEESRSRILGLECLKCGSVSSLKLFLHSETVATSTRYSTTHRTKSIKIPVCANCFSEFSSWQKSHSTSRNSYYNLICIIFWGIVGFGVSYAFFPSYSIFVILAWVGGILYIVYKRLSKSQNDSPFRYVKFRGKKTYVRSRGTGSWIKYDIWLKQLTPQISLS